MEASTEELECRVCRSGAEVDRELFAPCKCTGSIGLVHQDCLEAWLQHAQKTKCELCASEYIFSPLYAPNTPAVLPLNVVIETACYKVIFDLIPGLFKILAAIIIWLFIVPVCTARTYRMWIRTNSQAEYSDINAYMSDIFYYDVVGGIVICTLIIFTCIVALSFADFMRFLGAQDQNQRQQQQQVQLPLQQELRFDNEPVANEVGVPGAQVGGADRVRNEHNMGFPHNPDIASEDGNEDVGIHRRRRGRRFYVEQEEKVGDVDDDHELEPQRFRGRRKNVKSYDREVVSDSTSPSAYGTRSKARAEKSNIAKMTSNLGQRDGVLERPDVGETDRSLRGRSFADAASSSRAFDIEVEVGRMHSWVDRESESSTDIDPLESFLEHSHQVRSNDSLSQSNIGKCYDEYSFQSDDGSLDGLHGNESEGSEEILLEERQLNNPLPDHPEEQPLDPPVDDVFIDNQNDDIDFDGDHDILDQQAQEAHLALDRLLGLRGIGNLLRNSLWLYGFNFIFIAVFVALPYLIGLATHQILADTAPILSVQRLARSHIPILYQVAVEVIGKSSKSPDAFQVLDLLLLTFGHVLILFIIFLVNEAVQFGAGYFSKAQPLAATLGSLAGIAKVGMLLFIRVFFLPIVLGGVILYYVNIFVDYPRDLWVDFVATNIAGAGALAWVFGITYMVTTTLSVLQLREILHPSYLAAFVRPQEPHLDLLNSLMLEPLWVHFRRICASMVIYLTLLYLFAYLPLLLTRHFANFINSQICSVTEASICVVDTVVGHDSAVAENNGSLPRNQLIFKLYFRYFIPQLQIPFEVTIAHFSILTLVDRKKNVIGRCLHGGLLAMCNFLGLTRFLLPHGYRRTAEAPTHLQLLTLNEGDAVERDLECYYVHDARGNRIVGPPMKRPLPGWDIKANRNTNRWAWINESKSILEINTVPVLVPSWWLLRIFVLLLFVWIALSIFSLFVIFGPLLLGRGVLLLLQFPLSLHEAFLHDPFCFGVGCMLCGVLASIGSKISLQGLLKLLRNLTKLPLSMAATATKTLVAWIFCELSVGLSIQLLIAPVDNLSAIWSLPFFWSIYVKGSIFMALGGLAVYSGYGEQFLRFFRLTVEDFGYILSYWRKRGSSQQIIADNSDSKDELAGPEQLDAINERSHLQLIAKWQQVRQQLTDPFLALESGNWASEQLRLENIYSLLTTPLFLHTLRYPLLPSIIVLKYFSNSGISFVEQNLRKLALASLALWISPILLALIRSRCRTIYVAIRDARYLVGRKLRNASRTANSSL